jgi:hypothetical protein
MPWLQADTTAVSGANISMFVLKARVKSQNGVKLFGRGIFDCFLPFIDLSYVAATSPFVIID